jgi:hypothetical protein
LSPKQLTPEDQAELREINATLAAIDPWAFVSEFVITQDEHDKENPFKRFPDKLMYRVITRAWEEHPVLFIEKSRQIMVTWMFASLYLWDALFFKGRKHFLQSKRQEDADDIIDRCRTVYEHLVAQGFPGLAKAKTVNDRTGTTSRLQFDNRSVIRAIPQGPDIVRGPTSSGILSDEIAFQFEAEKAYEACLPSIHGGGRFTAPSTPNGRAFNWRMMYAIDPRTGFPAGPDRVDSAHQRELRYTPEQLMKMDSTQFKAIPFDELVACVPGMRYRVTHYGIPVLRVHYSADPDKSPDTEQGRRWIAEAKTTMTADAWEREMEISYDTFEGRPIIGNWERNIFVKKFEYDPESAIYMGVDFGSEVCCALFAQYLPITGFDFKQLRFIDEILLRNSDTPSLAKAMIERLKIMYTKAWDHRNIKVFPDPAGHQRRETTSDKSQNTSIKILTRAGLPIKSKKIGVPESTSLTQALFGQVAPNGEPAALVHPRCDYTIRVLAGGWRFPDKDVGTNSGHPLKDGEFDHGGDCVRQLVDNLVKIDAFFRRKQFKQSVPVREYTTGRIIGWRH